MLAKLNIQISDPTASWWCGNSGCIPRNNLDRNGTCCASSIELNKYATVDYKHDAAYQDKIANFRGVFVPHKRKLSNQQS